MNYPEKADKLLTALLTADEVTLGQLAIALGENTYTIESLIVDIQKRKKDWLEHHPHRRTKEGPTGTINIFPTMKPAVDHFLKDGGFVKDLQVEQQLQVEAAREKQMNFKKLELEIDELRKRPAKDNVARWIGIAAIIIPIIYEISKSFWLGSK